jgi:hypothetical protein
MMTDTLDLTAIRERLDAYCTEWTPNILATHQHDIVNFVMQAPDDIRALLDHIEHLEAALQEIVGLPTPGKWAKEIARRALDGD